MKPIYNVFEVGWMTRVKDMEIYGKNCPKKIDK